MQFRSLFARLRTPLGSLVLLSVLSGSAVSSGGKVGRLPSETVANQAIRTVDGQTFSLAGLRGKVVVLDFFAVWCGHSKTHIPAITEYGEADKNQGLRIIGLAVDDAESTPARLRQFIQEMKIEYPVGMIGDREFSRFVDSRDVSVPQTLVYGRDGRLAAHFTGHDRKTEKELAQIINRELQKP
jgi:thiol-disulfide isomerase/thioredoxin